MFHTPNAHLVNLQSEALGIPLFVKATEGEKEKELDDLKSALQWVKDTYDVEGVVTGAIASTYQSIRIQKVCNTLSLWCFNPLWQMDQFDVVKEVIESGYEVFVSGVFAYPMEEKWLGRTLTEEMLKELCDLHKNYGISPSGEGGEFETTVLDGPIFKRGIKVLKIDKKFKNNAGVANIVKTGWKI